MYVEPDDTNVHLGNPNHDYQTFLSTGARTEDRNRENLKYIDKPQEDVSDAAHVAITARAKLTPVVLILTASCMFSGMHACVRYTTTNYHIIPLFVVFFRGVFQLFFSSILLIIFRRQVFPERLSNKSLLLLCLRGFLGSAAIICKYSSLVRLPVAVASSLFSTTPVIASVLGWVLLREALTSIDIAAIALSTIAIILVALSHPSSHAVLDMSVPRFYHIEGVLLALCGAACTGSVFVTVRSMGVRVHFLLSVFALSLSICIAPFLMHAAQSGSVVDSAVSFSNIMFASEQGAYFGLLGVGLCASLAALCINRGAQLIEAGKVGVLRTADIPTGFLVGYLFLHEFPGSLGQLAGCGIILLSSCLIAWKQLS